ncbi:unnamed protein product [Brassica napus]|uniref:(rape) hypothetical protein n=1 Tax=Brassica napus TaxID=3708 RepID=A0A816I818_BRANA|nr:unnamed protein product [Brassica napus]
MLFQSLLPSQLSSPILVISKRPRPTTPNRSLVDHDAVVYVIWRERNTRLHNSTSRSISTLLKEVHLLIRAKLFGLDRNASPPQLRSASVSPPTTYLQLWFGHFQNYVAFGGSSLPFFSSFGL